MTVYPITWPFNLEIRTRRIVPDFNEAVFEGQFSRHEQIQQHSAGQSDRWVGIWTTTQLDPAQIAEAEVTLASLRGKLGTFLAYDPDRRLPAGADDSTVLWAGDSTKFAGDSTTFAGVGISPFVGTVNGAGQTGNTLAVTFEVVSAQVLTKGDYFQIHEQYLMLLVSPVTDGSGNVTLEFEPALRFLPDDGDLVIVINPKMIARLDEQFKGADTNEARFGVVSFSFHEVISNG